MLLELCDKMVDLKSEDYAYPDEDIKKCVRSWKKSKIITEEGLPTVENTMSLLIYKHKTESRDETIKKVSKPIWEFVNELLTLFIGVSASFTFSSTSYKSYLFATIILIVLRIISYTKYKR